MKNNKSFHNHDNSFACSDFARTAGELVLSFPKNIFPSDHFYFFVLTMENREVGAASKFSFEIFYDCLWSINKFISIFQKTLASSPSNERIIVFQDQAVFFSNRDLLDSLHDFNRITQVFDRPQVGILYFPFPKHFTFATSVQIILGG